MLSIAAALVCFCGLLAACTTSDPETRPSPTKKDDAGGKDASQTNDEGGSTPSPRDSAKYAEGVCKFFELCNRGYLEQLYGDLDSCSKIINTDTSAILNAKGNAVTQEQIDACLAKVGRTCADRFDTVPECDFRGTAPIGNSCSFNAQCESGFCIWESGECGKCHKRGGVGDNCTTTVCEFGLACNVNGQCVKLAKENEPCLSNRECDGDNYCVGGTCVKPLGRGAPCATNGATAGCFDQRAALNCVNGTCQDMTPSPLNGPCNPVAFCKASTCSSFSQGGTCVAFVTEGNPCTEDGPLCAPNTFCVAGICRGRHPEICF